MATRQGNEREKQKKEQERETHRLSPSISKVNQLTRHKRKDNSTTSHPIAINRPWFEPQERAASIGPLYARFD
eukprot:scaffold140615_cov47-Attheya_sp.AAC.3